MDHKGFCFDVHILNEFVNERTIEALAILLFDSEIFGGGVAGDFNDFAKKISFLVQGFAAL